MVISPDGLVLVLSSGFDVWDTSDSPAIIKMTSLLMVFVKLYHWPVATSVDEESSWSSGAYGVFSDPEWVDF